jgi:hypothetical protein
MGGGHYEDKNGGGYDVDADRATKAIGQGVGPDPGKTTKTGSMTGVPLVDHGVACDKPAPGQAGCYLDALQRRDLVSDIQLRMTDAKATFLDACTNVRVDKLLEKDSDVPWFLGMMLDIATAFAATKMIEALKGLKQGIAVAPVVEEYWALNETHTAINTIGVEAQAKKTLKERVRSIDDAAIVQATQTAMAKGKAAVSAVLQKAANDPAAQKAAALDYVAELKDKAGIAFDAARRTMPVGLSDEQLLALDEAWQPSYHSSSGYTQAITAQVNLFNASGISKIGRSVTERVPVDDDGHAIAGGAFANTPVRRDVRVAWYHYVSGWPKQLVFQHQDAERDPEVIHMDDPGMSEAAGTEKGAKHYTFGPPGGEIDERPMNGIDNRTEGAFIIDPSLWDVAIEKHTMTWGSAPEHFTVDESAWNWDPPRMRAALAQKAAKASKNVPTLQLGKPMQPATVTQVQAIKDSPRPSTPLPKVGSTPLAHRH